MRNVRVYIIYNKKQAVVRNKRFNGSIVECVTAEVTCCIRRKTNLSKAKLTSEVIRAQ